MEAFTYQPGQLLYIQLGEKEGLPCHYVRFDRDWGHIVRLKGREINCSDNQLSTQKQDGEPYEKGEVIHL